MSKPAMFNDYTQGVCEDGAAILRNSLPLTVEEILQLLRERETYLNAALSLHATLDHIDTCGDAYKPELTPYVEKINELVRDRHDHFTTDGYCLYEIESQKKVIDLTGDAPVNYFKQRDPIEIIVTVESGMVHTVVTSDKRQPFKVTVLDSDESRTHEEQKEFDARADEAYKMRTIL